jgi:2-polyprenyl-6-methoxyphenol hydroxylase-like FAD-dependent oxidoreductase
MTLRDLSILEKILGDKIKLGLDIGGADILNEFSSKIKSRNFAFSVGIDFTKRFFSIKQKPFKSFRNLFLSKLNQNQTVKNFFYNLGDKGLKF